MKAIRHYLIPALFVLILCATLQSAHSKDVQFASGVTVNPLFSEHMVLQRNIPISVWGKAKRTGRVIVQIEDATAQTTVDTKGNWKVALPPMEAGGPYSLKIISTATLAFTDVYIGDVWICSGQSNMEWPLAKAQNGAQESARAKYPLIRLLTVEQKLASHPQEIINTSGWKKCSPETAASFSAVAYFFGRELYSTQDIPIGLIQSTWSGTAIQSWMSTDALNKFPEYSELIKQVQSQNVSYGDIESINQKWIDSLPGKDIGLEQSPPWHSASLNDNDWKDILLPTHWERSGKSDLLVYDGVVWFRRNFFLPETWHDADTTLSLGPIDDEDTTWINGQLVGKGQIWDIPRQYPIPESILHPGENQLTVRVLDYASLGGLWATNPTDLHIRNTHGEIIQLAGNWQYKIGIPVNKMPPHADINTPTMIYNAMIHPLTPFGIRGFIWYQGEANTWEPSRYRALFSAMIKDWRKQWKQEDLPFYYVQLANFLPPHPVPRENEWAELREAQLMVLSIPNTGMAVSIDVGDANTIHPVNKQDVGRRLAVIARNKVYGENIPYSGPIYSSMQIEREQIRLLFNHADDGLKTKNNGQLKGFSIAGSDKNFLWADAKIEGKTVVVSHPQIKSPRAVRYAWDANPICNLYNRAGLPASPFRTDIKQETKNTQ